MSDQIQRPVFFEGQILGAVDLEAAVEYSRGQGARHERYLHTWGIASGLELSAKPKQLEKNGATIDYQEISMSPGLAIDGRGREIVVPEARRLPEDDFDQLNVAITDVTALYPVLLIGRDRTAPASAFSVGDCAAAEPTRKVEDYEITFRGPGEDLDLGSQQVPDISAGAGTGEASESWMVLIGFVRWNGDIKKFTGFELTSSGVSRRYAGVLADEVAARGGSLLLRTRPKNESGKPAVVLDETDGGTLKFGLLNAAGIVTPVLTVNAKGDVKAEGTISGALSSGSVYVQSGVATDGIILPLPSGVAPDQVGPGKATVHIQVTPRLAGLTPPIPNPSIASSRECQVDANRRLNCLVQWTELDVPHTVTVLQGSCDYIVMVAVPATAGGTP